MLPIVIVNPQSAGGSTREAWPKMASTLASHLGAFDPHFTRQPGEATELAAAAARRGTKFIIACGGDGTVSEVANGILAAGSDTELGILPSGTGGDFRRSIGIPVRTADAASILHNGRTRVIDVGKVTFTTLDGEQETRYFLGVASFGMSAAVISRAKKGGFEWLPTKGPKWLTGRLSYGAAMVQTAVKVTATRVLVEVDDEPARHLTVINLCIANGRFFGGGMKIAPDAKLTDGKLDVVSIGNLSAAKILASTPRLYTGKHLGMAEVGHTLAKKLFARSLEEARVSIEVDGELPGYLPATFQIVPAALRIRCP